MALSATVSEIRLRQKLTLPDKPGEESAMSLAEKLEELLGAGYSQDDLFGLVIPLLMQGKVRINRGEKSERLELENEAKFPRTEAVRIFEDFVSARPVAVTAPAAATT